jgi:hypothetical protein
LDLFLKADDGVIKPRALPKSNMARLAAVERGGWVDGLLLLLPVKFVEGLCIVVNGVCFIVLDSSCGRLVLIVLLFC